jgi:hypothetical protein
MKVRFCKVAVADDYHAFEIICKSFIGLNLQHKEIGTFGKNYVAVIYDGNSPGDSEIDDCLLEAGIEKKKLIKYPAGVTVV